MATGSLTIFCLLFATGAGSSDAWPMNQRDFQIPIKIEANRRDSIKELYLYSSPNQGRSWHQEAVATPDKEAFNFHAPADGVYWFKICVVDKQGKRDPEDIPSAPVGAKILVDTVKPDLRIVSAERQGDNIVVRWDIKEDNPDPATLKLEYRVSGGAGDSWTPVAITPTLSGQATFPPSGPGAVSVRMQIQDLAQNLGTGQAELPAATQITTGYTPAPPPPAPNPLPPNGNGWSPIQPAQVLTNARPPLPNVPDRIGPPPVTGTNPPPSMTGFPTSPVVASTLESPNYAAPIVNPAPTRLPRGAMPPVQMINNRQLTLDYEVAKFGPSGVGSVDLYITRDDGLTWQKFAGDQAPGLPPSPLDPKGTSGAVHRSLTVELQGEGRYGFWLVVKSGAGLGKSPPQNGDAPQLRVELDATQPFGELYPPEPDLRQPDTLVISWKATDRNIAQNPITLEWSERKDGRWEPIGTELPNTGRFSWRVPATVPPSVYLRLIVRDTAGNVAIAETSQPVLVDLNEPIVTKLSVGNNPR